MKAENIDTAIVALENERRALEVRTMVNGLPQYEAEVARIDAAIADLTAERAAPEAGDAVVQPSLANAPSWANWWAMDEDNDAFWYEAEPRRGFSQWLPEGCRYVMDDRNSGAWRTTLQPRPATTGKVSE